MTDNEKTRSVISGYPMLFLGILLIAAAIACLVMGIRTGNHHESIGPTGQLLIASMIASVLGARFTCPKT